MPRTGHLALQKSINGINFDTRREMSAIIAISPHLQDNRSMPRGRGTKASH